MRTEVVYDIKPVSKQEWEFTCNWAIYENTGEFLFEMTYIGPKHWFRKKPKNIWIRENDIEIAIMIIREYEDEA